MIEDRVHALLSELAAGNPFGEPVVLVAATKTRTPEEIGRAVDAGIRDVGENRVQEFCAKAGKIHGATLHFIGHLQTNKVKYLVGNCALIHSVDRDELAEAIARRANALGCVQDVLIQINIGNEDSKGGYPFEEGMRAYLRLKELGGIRIRGFMAMLPLSDDEQLLSSLADRMRALFDEARKTDGTVSYLSMGMSGDFRLCVRHGANMVRLGTTIFGER